MKNTKNAFTLVELIVVITILAILGTIAFISLQGYSADARNSKRTSDINNVVTKMNIQSTEGVALASFVTSGQEVTSASIAGTGASDSGYVAGEMNTTVLGIKAEDFKDPSNNVGYKAGVTTAKGGQFEVAASMENGSGERESKINGTYKPRAVTDTAEVSATGSISGGVTTVTITDASINTFFKGDIVGNGTATGEVLKVSADLSSLTIDASLTLVPTDTLALDAAESAGLIGSAADAANPVTEGSTTDLPY